MTRTFATLAIVAAAALAGCNNDDHTIVAGPPVDTGPVTNTANVQLPPAIAASKTYRCADNKIVTIDWLADNKTANVRTEKNGAPTQVTAAEAGQPMTAAGGYSVTGTPTASSVTIAVPGRSGQSCKA